MYQMHNSILPLTLGSMQAGAIGYSPLYSPCLGQWLAHSRSSIDTSVVIKNHLYKVYK